MTDPALCEESFFFIPVETLCRGEAITCDPATSVVEAARRMRDHGITCLIVVAQDAPVGIVSVRDLRNLIADASGDLTRQTAGDIMHAGLISVRDRAPVYEAIFKMAKHNIHRLGVVDQDGRLVGVITDTDLLSLQTRSPIYLTREIEAAESIEQLRQISSHTLEMVQCAMRAGADIRNLVQLISHFNDTATLRIIALLEAQEGLRLPAGVAYLALGSEGRGEQTLRTDQDSAIVYRDDLPPDELETVRRFADRLVDSLEAIGVPRCPGDTMANNAQWCHSLSEWFRLLEDWIATPKSEHMVNFGMFQDFRTIYGDTSFEEKLHQHIYDVAKRQSLFFPYMARHIVRFPPPLGWFGRFRVERRGEYRGKVDLKKAGIFAITEGVSLLGLEAGLFGGSTWEKLERLGHKGILSKAELETIMESFTYLVNLRLRRQLRDIAGGNPPTNAVDPLIMTDKEQDHLREALKGVSQFLRYMRDHYKLDFISR